MIALTPHMQAAAAGYLQRWAVCWKIERRDGEVVCGTDHNADLVLADGFTYHASTGLSVSAESRQTNLGVRERGMNSVIDDDQITYEDLESGRYKMAKVTQYLVDWRTPWAGAFTTSVSWIVDVEFDDGTWKVSIEGMTRRLNYPTGRYYTNNEPVAGLDSPFEDARGDLLTWTTSSEITVISGTHDFGDGAEDLNGRQTFEIALQTTAGYYDWGRLTPLTGANVGLSFDIAVYTATGGVKLLLEAPNAFAVGDTFALIAGYTGTMAEARDKFGSLDGFRGYPYIPGGDRLYLVPDVK